jgi:hypothetical protein
MIAPFLSLVVIAVTNLTLATRETARLLLLPRIIERQAYEWRMPDLFLWLPGARLELACPFGQRFLSALIAQIYANSN